MFQIYMLVSTIPYFFVFLHLARKIGDIRLSTLAMIIFFSIVPIANVILIIAMFHEQYAGKISDPIIFKKKA